MGYNMCYTIYQYTVYWRAPGLKYFISRLSRLKKSANHEANKIIFHGLEEEKGVYPLL